jgi:hypothetical protein
MLQDWNSQIRKNNPLIDYNPLSELLDSYIHDQGKPKCSATDIATAEIV